jgi:DNA polymerase III gamma/tau subunit
MEGGRDAEQFILSLVQFFRNLAVLKVTREPGSLLEESPEYLAELRKACEGYTISQITSAIDELLQILPKLSATEAKQTILELAVLKLIHVRSRISADLIFAKLEELEKGSVTLEKEKETKEPKKQEAPEGDVALARQLFPGSRLDKKQ